MIETISALDFVPLVPEIFLAALAMLLLMVGAFGGNRLTRVIIKLSILALILTGSLLLSIDSARTEALNSMFVSDYFAVFVKLILLAATGFVLLLLRNYQKNPDKNHFEFSVLILLSLVGMMGMVSAHDLIALYMALELQSLSLYILASMNRDSSRSAEAGLKYFVLGALSSCILLFGASLIYGFTGTTNFAGIAQFLSNGQATVGVIVGLVLVMVGLCFKVSAVPFHMWTPDVYEGSPTIITTFFATAPKFAAIALFIRLLMEPFAPIAQDWQQVMIFVSAASMIVGAIAALKQSSIKRILAYSSIGHVGYVLMGLAAHSEDGIRSMLVYMAIYITMSLGAFACVFHMRKQGEPTENILELAGMSKSQPVFAAVLSILMLSMAGIPPLAGFFGKFFIFKAALDAGLFGLAVLGVLTSVIAAYYYIRIIKIMYFDEGSTSLDTGMSKEVRLILVCTASFNLLFFIAPAYLLDLAKAAAISIIVGI